MAKNVYEPIETREAAHARYGSEWDAHPQRVKYLPGERWTTVPIAGNTLLCKHAPGSDSGYTIRFFDNNLTTYHTDGVVTIDPCGKLVMTALERLRRYLCSQGVCQARGWWCVNHVRVWWRGTGPSGNGPGDIFTWETRPYHLMPKAVSAVMAMPEYGTRLLTGHVRGLVEAMVEGEGYGPLPVLADALEEAGFEDAATLAALRSGRYADGPNELVARLYAAAKHKGNLSKVFLTRKAVAK
jgi:hypothetical protein